MTYWPYHLIQVVNTTVNNNLTVKLLPKIPLPKDPTGVLEMAIVSLTLCFCLPVD